MRVTTAQLALRHVATDEVGGDPNCNSGNTDASTKLASVTVPNVENAGPHHEFPNRRVNHSLSPTPRCLI